LIYTEHLYREFDQTVAINEVSLRVASGEIYGLVGPDGAGKTTIMRLICGALQPSERKDLPPAMIKLCGYDVLMDTEQARSQIGYLPQRFSLYEELTVLENIRFFAEVRGIPSSEWQPRCMEILRFVGLDTFVKWRAGQLSGGMKQKLGLAAALVHQPKILLLDEPTTGVDPVTRQDFWQLIIQLVSRQEYDGTAVLVSTPYMDEASRCSRIGFLSNGKLIREGTPVALCAQLEGRIIELSGQPLAVILDYLHNNDYIEGVQKFGDRFHIRVPAGQAEHVISQLREQLTGPEIQLNKLRTVAPQLEDVFMELLEGTS